MNGVGCRLKSSQLRSNMLRSDRFWVAYTAFKVQVGRHSHGLALHTADGTLMIVDDEKRLPSVLHRAAWGNQGYSTWCSSPQHAVDVAIDMCKMTDSVDVLESQPWMVLELCMSSSQICAMLNDYVIEKGANHTWRISTDIYLPSVIKGGGYIGKTIYGPHSQCWREPAISADSHMERGMCCKCKHNAPLVFLFEKLCHKCYSSQNFLMAELPWRQHHAEDDTTSDSDTATMSGIDA